MQTTHILTLDDSTSQTPSLSARLAGLAGAVRFSWIPIVCALVVAIASQHTRGRALAAALALLSLAIGFVMHAREIVLGQPQPTRIGAAREEIDAEWMKAVA
jgi:disulfide bond formation protein DsbB